MTSPRAKSERDWNVLEAILDEVLEAPTEDRRKILDAKCGNDVDLRASVEELLDACDKQRGFLDTPAAAFAAKLAAEEAAREQGPAAGTVIGSYRLIREIARGGMGSVYLAERADGQFEQRVALKLIKRGMDSEELHRRFLAERRILARLSHPNIARLFDGGMTREGQPWFAMEFVDGKSITKYSDEHSLSVEKKITLFEEVCEAVKYAHQNLVIHRDLKPSNILITADGQVKLLDFGIAKLLEDRSAESPATMTDVRMMTPEYASPEQVRGDPVTTATDVYALGAVLYEVLSGKRAHEFKRRSPAEIERVVLEVDPEPPSIAASHERKSDARALSGDLDTIVLKSLQKDPARRYQSVEALDDDLRRFTSGLPVTARPDTIRYRARKFIRRYRVLVTATAVVVLALAAGLAGTLWQASAASRQARLASAEAAKATRVKEFLVGLFRGSDPREALQRDVMARDLLERGTRNLDTALVAQPDVRAELLDILGVIHGEIALFPKADTLFRRSVEVSRNLYGPSDSLVLNRLSDWAAMLFMWSKYEQADTILRQVLQERRRTLPPDHPGIASTLSQLGELQRVRGKFDEADTLLRTAIAIHRKRGKKDDLQLAQDLNALGDVLNEHGEPARADSAAVEALAIRRARLNADHPLVLTSEKLRALILLDLGKYEEAQRIMTRVVDVRRKLYGDQHLLFADALNALGRAVEDQGNVDSAHALYTRALEINRKTLGDDHNATIVMANNLAVLRYRLRQLPGAVAAMRIARNAWIRTLGRDHIYSAAATNNLGAMLSDLGEYREAEPLIREGLALRIKILGDTSIEAAQSMRNLGILLHRTGRRREAEDTLRRALQSSRKLLGAEHPRVAEVETALGSLLNDVRRPNESEVLLRDALAIRIKALSPADVRIAETQGALGECLMLRGHYAEAEKLIRSSFVAYKSNGRDSIAIAKAQRRLSALSGLRKGSN